MLQTIVRDGVDGQAPATRDSVLVPVPQYPLWVTLRSDSDRLGGSNSPQGPSERLAPPQNAALTRKQYTATLEMLGGHAAPYYLDFERGWGMDVSRVRELVKAERAAGREPRALVTISPGNPTGSILGEENMRDVGRLCEEEGLVLMADEVYQKNVYDQSTKFTSFKKVVRDLNSPVELFSFHSTSKGVLGECGRRGGYMEYCNIDAEVKEQLYKLASVSLCPNVDGQIVTDCMVKPPNKGSPEGARHDHEQKKIFDALGRRAVKVVDALNKLEGVRCQPAAGAMYVHPRLTLSPKVVEAAKAEGRSPDTYYCLELLDKTGLCVVPGAGFGQEDGTYHFRSTFLAGEDIMDGVLERMSKFHAKFTAKHALKHEFNSTTRP